MNKRINSHKNIQELNSYLRDNIPNVYKEFKVVDYIKNDEVILKGKFGIVKSTKARLKNGFKPSVHSAINKTKYCVNQFKEIHGDRYDYSKVNYNKDNKKITITCKEHGEFEQTPNVHKNGSGCMKCSHKEHHGVYSLKNAEKYKKEWSKENTFLYIFDLYSDEEVFRKIGISKDYKRRVRQIKRGCNNKYNISVALASKMSLYDAIKFENELFKNECFPQHKPKTKFQGYTECFNPIKINYE